MSDNSRIIHTGLFSARAYQLIETLIADLQCHYKRKHAKKTKKIASLLNTIITRGVDNEVILEVHSNYYYRKTNLWNDLTDNQVLRHIVWMYKGFIQQSIEKDSWKRVNNEHIPYSDSDFKISEVYFLYDMFHQRNNFKRNYPDTYSEDLIGIPLDPITVELKNTQAAEIEKIKNETALKISELKNQKYCEREEIYKTIDKKYAVLISEVEAASNAKIKQLKDEMESISSLNLLANVG